MIGDKPKTYYTLNQLRGMDKNQMIDVVIENGWLDIIGREALMSDWYEIHENQIALIIHTKMNEWRQEVVKKQ